MARPDAHHRRPDDTADARTQRYGPDAVTSRDFVQMTRRPDADRFAARGDRHPDRSGRSASAAPASARARRTRTRARRAGARCRASVSRTVGMAAAPLRHAPAPPPAGARRRRPPRRPRCRAGTCVAAVQRRRWWHWQIASRDTVTSSGDQRAVARRPRRPVDADDRRADRRRDVRSGRCRRTPSAPRRARARPGRRSSSAATAPRRRPRAPRPPARDASSPGPHNTTDVRPCRSRSAPRPGRTAPAASACSATPRRD